MRYAEGGGRRASDRLEFGLRALRLELVFWRGCLRGSELAGGLGLVRTRLREKTLAEGRLKIGDELFQDAGGRFADGKLGCGRFNVKCRRMLRFRNRRLRFGSLVDDGRSFVGCGRNFVAGEFGRGLVGGEFRNGLNRCHFFGGGVLGSGHYFRFNGRQDGFVGGEGLKLLEGCRGLLRHAVLEIETDFLDNLVGFFWIGF